MKKIFIFLFFCLTVNVSTAQQDKQFTHYLFDRMSFNPATTGFKGYCGTLMYRNQWDRVQDAPNSTMINLQGNLTKQNMGVGMSFVNDAIGFQRSNTLTLNWAYHYPTAYGVLSGGVALGIINVGFNPVWIPPQTLTDANLPTATSGTTFDANIGLFFHGTQGYYAGLSMTHVPAIAISKNKGLDQLNYGVARHYYIVAGYDFPLSERMNWGRKIELKPSLLIKADGATAIFDINIMADIWLNAYSYIYAGLSYRMADAIPIMVGYGFSPSNNAAKNFLKFGYSFDIMTNPLNTYGKGTHELFVNYCMFPPPPVIPRHGNPFILQ